MARSCLGESWPHASPKRSSTNPWAPDTTSSATGHRHLERSAHGRSRGLRQSFLNGSLTRPVDPDAVLKTKLVGFVARGDFELSSGRRPDGTYERSWFHELVAADEVAFEADVFLLRKPTIEALKTGQPVSFPQPQPTETLAPILPGLGPTLVPAPGTATAMRTVRVAGSVPPEVWNRLGTRILPKLRSGVDLKVGVEFSVAVPDGSASGLATEMRQVLQKLGLANSVRVE